MPDIVTAFLTTACCGGALALVVYAIYRAARTTQANPRRYVPYGDDDEEFWEADSPDESPPDFF